MDQATAEADPYNWTFFTNSVAGSTGSGGLYGRGRYGKGLYGRGEGSTAVVSFSARRRQEHGMVYQYGDTLTDLLTRITSYEADVASRGGVVTHDWGPVVGPPRTVDGSRVHVQLISPGN